MTHQIIKDVLNNDQIEYIFSLPEVINAREKINSGIKNVYFNITLTNDMKESLAQQLQIDLSSISTIPMRWIQGDTLPHMDRGSQYFSNTYLMYLNDNPGQFIIENESYPITKNSAFIFNEGIRHETMNTGMEPRLLLGPMSEMGLSVGGTNIQYYPSEADALSYTNNLGGNSSDFIVGNTTFGTNGGFTSWRIASNSSGPANQSLTYTNGQVLPGTLFVDYYYLYPSAPCFLEGTKILCLIDNEEKYIPIEDMKKDTLVKTSRDGFKKVAFIGKGSINNPATDERIENRLYKCSKEKYPELTEDLFITGCHSILVNNITDKQREDTIKSLGKIYITDKKYRLMASIDDRSEPWISEGLYTIWHFALEHEDKFMNYGIYANGGLLVETCSICFMKKYSNMTLL